jgi:hypothetical protein
MPTKYSFSDKKEFFNKSGDISIFELDNLKILNGGNTIKRFTGIYFPVRYSVNYSILLYDYIGVYLILKKTYPDLKIIFFKQNNSLYSNPQFNATSDDFVKYFNSEIINIDKDNFVFDKIILTEGDMTVIPMNVFSTPSWKYDELSNPVKLWWFDSLKNVVSEFLNSLLQKENSKLYMTRSLSNKEHINRNDSWSSLRAHNTLYDENLDNILFDKKYNVVEGIGKGFFEQASLAYNANIFVTIEGSAMFNAIWCKEDTPIVMIKTKKKYQFYYKEMFEFLNKRKFFIIDVSDLLPEDGIKYIITKLTEIENNFI